MGLEGIVSKRRDRPYRSGRSADWIKVKNPDAPAATRVSIGAQIPLLLATVRRRPWASQRNPVLSPANAGETVLASCTCSNVSHITNHND